MGNSNYEITVTDAVRLDVRCGVSGDKSRIIRELDRKEYLSSAGRCWKSLGWKKFSVSMDNADDSNMTPLAGIDSRCLEKSHDELKSASTPFEYCCDQYLSRIDLTDGRVFEYPSDLAKKSV
jgi:hypothetical protein